MSRVIVAGDVHLGSHNANAEAFDAFLGDLSRNLESIDEVVLLGALWDMIRRDPLGVAWETVETLDRPKCLAADVPVQYVLGNHDAYLAELDSSRYELKFRDQ